MGDYRLTEEADTSSFHSPDVRHWMPVLGQFFLCEWQNGPQEKIAKLQIHDHETKGGTVRSSISSQVEGKLGDTRYQRLNVRKSAEVTKWSRSLQVLEE